MLANPSRSCGSVNLIIRTNDLTHLYPFSVLTHGATWDSSPSVHAGHMMHLNNNIQSHTHTLHVQVTHCKAWVDLSPPRWILYTQTHPINTQTRAYVRRGKRGRSAFNPHVPVNPSNTLSPRTASD